MNFCKLYILIIITLIQTLFDPTLYACTTLSGRFLLIIHHAINIGFWTGSLLFGHHRLHLMILIIAIVLHMLLDGCFLTTLNNRICKINPDKHVLVTFINHIMNFLGCKKYVIFVYYLMAIAIAYYDIRYMISKTNN